MALAVAWAVYLIPKALEHHEESARTRTVERFSATLRVLARREPINRRKARLVPARLAVERRAGPTEKVLSERRKSSTSTSLDAKPPLSPAQLRAHRRASARAAKRRLRVVSLILVANAAVAGLAYFKFFDWVWCAVPVGVLVVWLVACRVMVKRERAELPERPDPGRAGVRAAEGPDRGDRRVDDPTQSGDEPAERDPDSWDPVSVPLPTYVSKPVATRSVSTIDLDSTGVWSSGHNASDSKLAREAEAAERPASSESGERRASGA